MSVFALTPAMAAQSRLTARRRALAEGVLAALIVYVVAGVGEAALIAIVHPTELELTRISDVVLAAAFGVAVYLWRHLRATRHELTTLERAELILQTQLALAEDMQRRLLSAPPPRDGFEWAAALIPAGHRRRLLRLRRTAAWVWLTLVADVSGKGVPAAMALGVLRSSFRRLARESEKPAALACDISTTLYDEWQGAPYVTGIVAEIDTRTGRLTYVNCGHPAGMRITARRSSC